MEENTCELAQRKRKVWRLSIFLHVACAWILLLLHVTQVQAQSNASKRSVSCLPSWKKTNRVCVSYVTCVCVLRVNVAFILHLRFRHITHHQALGVKKTAWRTFVVLMVDMYWSNRTFSTIETFKSTLTNKRNFCPIIMDVNGIIPTHFDIKKTLFR